jgi:hypothetical protein
MLIKLLNCDLTKSGQKPDFWAFCDHDARKNIFLKIEKYSKNRISWWPTESIHRDQVFSSGLFLVHN